MQLKILFYDIEEEEKKEEEKEEKSLNKKIIEIFINEHIVVGKKINKDLEDPENNYISFTYQIKAGNTAEIYFYQINQLNKAYSINLIADACFILIDIEDQYSLNKLIKILQYINDNCPKEMETYILGIYNNKINIVEEFKEEKIKKLLNKKKLLINYQDVSLLIENKEYKELNVTLEDLLFKIYDNKKNIKLSKIPISETQSFENFDYDDNSRSKCNIY